MNVFAGFKMKTNLKDNNHSLLFNSSVPCQTILLKIHFPLSVTKSLRNKTSQILLSQLLLTNSLADPKERLLPIEDHSLDILLFLTKKSI